MLAVPICGDYRKEAARSCPADWELWDMDSQVAIGAQIGNPDKPVIVISGDGGMQMNIQEFATAVLEELPVIICVFNNEYLGMVRQWQKLFLWQAIQHD